MKYRQNSDSNYINNDEPDYEEMVDDVMELAKEKAENGFYCMKQDSGFPRCKQICDLCQNSKPATA